MEETAVVNLRNVGKDDPARALTESRWVQWVLIAAAMAFMSGPRLALLDEPAGGVNPAMIGQLRERLRAYHAERRATFVVIEHQMEFVMAFCTRVLVLAEGRIIAEGAPQAIRENPAVIDAYLGH